jgi:hypothetical protein
MEVASSIILGICLSAACGFRVFVPLLVMSIAGVSGQLTLAESMSWLASWPALIALGSATVVEILAYYVPWADNALDAIATPAAMIAGTIATGAVLTDMSPVLQWVLAVIAGAGTAGAVQAGTVMARGASSVTTAGVGNPVVATAENALSAGTSVLALIVPVLALLLLVAVVVVAWRLIRRFRRGSRGGNGAAAGLPEP